MATQIITSKLVTGPVGEHIPDIADAVRLALISKARGPFIGIACGKKTVLVRREQFKASLKGLRIVDAELLHREKDGCITGDYRPWKGGGRSWNEKTNTYEAVPFTLGERERYQGDWALRVYAAAGRVKATRLFLHQELSVYANRKLVQDWQQAELKKRTPTGAKLNKYQKQIAVLEKRLQKLGRLQRPNNPMLVMESGVPVEFGGMQTKGVYYRHGEHLWHLQKPVRRAIMALALRTGWKHPHRTQVKADLTSAKLYQELAKITAPYYSDIDFQSKLDAINDGTYERIKDRQNYVIAHQALSFKKWSDLTTHERDRKAVHDIWEYLAKLWEFCGLQSKPFREGSWEKDPDYIKRHWGNARYYQWQAERDAHREIEIQIAAVKALESEAAK